MSIRDMHRYQVFLPEQLWLEINGIALEACEPVSGLIRRALTDYVRRSVKKDRNPVPRVRGKRRKVAGDK